LRPLLQQQGRLKIREGDEMRTSAIEVQDLLSVFNVDLERLS
jgi:hypothetical protein